MKNHLERIISEAESALAKLEEAPEQPTLKIVPVREGVVRAEWDPALAELPDFDIWFYTPEIHRPWQLNILMHVPDADLSQGYWEIPLNFEGIWLFQAKAEGYKSDVIEYTYKKKEDDPEPGDGELSTILYVDKPGDPYADIRGVIEEEDGTVKVYAHQRDGGNLLEFESKDLKNWKANGESPFPSGTFLFKPDGGRLHGYRAEGSDMHLYLGSRLQNHHGKAYTWKIDGAVRMHQAPGGYYRAFGRVRGNNQPRSEGGWGGQVPVFPKGDFQDRRGISYHQGAAWGKNWGKNRILADPAGYFRGYHDNAVDLVPDFYDSIFRPDGRGFVTVFWKSKSRQVDRRILDPSIPDNRRYRLTGEIYPVPALYRNSKITLFPDKTVIPRHFHERDPHPDIPYTGPKGKREIGEIYMGGILERGDNVHLFYKHRGGLHYEGHDDYPSGIYVYKITKDHFNSLFE